MSEGRLRTPSYVSFCALRWAGSCIVSTRKFTLFLVVRSRRRLSPLPVIGVLVVLPTGTALYNFRKINGSHEHDSARSQSAI